MKYKIGDKVRVITNLSSHGFKIGTIVTVKNLLSNGVVGEFGNEVWGLFYDEIELV